MLPLRLLSHQNKTSRPLLVGPSLMRSPSQTADQCKKTFLLCLSSSTSPFLLAFLLAELLIANAGALSRSIHYSRCEHSYLLISLPTSLTSLEGVLTFRSDEDEEEASLLMSNWAFRLNVSPAIRCFSIWKIAK